MSCHSSPVTTPPLPPDDPVPANTPPIPTVDNPQDNLPARSEFLVTETAELGNFSPDLEGASAELLGRLERAADEATGATRVSLLTAAAAVRELAARTRRPLRVLDVGCGGGILSEALAREGAQVTGIDLGQAALEAAYPELPFVWLEFEHGGAGVFLLTRSELELVGKN